MINSYIFASTITNALKKKKKGGYAKIDENFWVD